MAATAPSECRRAHRECRQVLPRRGLHNESLVPSDRSPTASKAQVAMVERPSVYASALVLRTFPTFSLSSCPRASNTLRRGQPAYRCSFALSKRECGCLPAVRLDRLADRSTLHTTLPSNPRSRDCISIPAGRGFQGSPGGDFPAAVYPTVKGGPALACPACPRGGETTPVYSTPRAGVS